MDILFWCCVILVVLLACVFALRAPSSSKPRPAEFQTSPVPAYNTANDPISKMTDREFKRWLEDDVAVAYDEEAAIDEWVELMAADIADQHFYQSVAGVSHRNVDGSSRQDLIAGCKPKERLRLEHDPENPVDAKAIRILTHEGFQLGYMPARCAHEIYRDALAGERFVVFVRSVGEVEGLYGMRIAVFRLNEKWRKLANGEG